MTFIAKKSLGQNFLHSPHAIGAMVFATEIQNGDIVLEVGPGKGALTSKLLEAGAKVIAFEKDDRAIPYLNDKFAIEIKNGQLNLVHGDILDLDIEKSELLSGKKYKISANIPYYITGELLRKFLQSDNQPEKIVVMLQKEVARRIIGEESQKTNEIGQKIIKESILSISIKVYGEPKYITTVSRKLFRPIPNVDSAILAINNITKDYFSLNEQDFERNSLKNTENITKIDENVFFDIVKHGFAHKRKVLIKNLQEKIDKVILEKLWNDKKWSPNMRAEDITVNDWKDIAIYYVCFPQKTAK